MSVNTTSTLAGILPNQWFVYGEDQSGMVIAQCGDTVHCVLYDGQNNSIRCDLLPSRLKVDGVKSAEVGVEIVLFESNTGE